jgi:hypothetical protein
MSNPFFDHPILNSPYEYPARHWELDETGQPTQRIIARRGASTRSLALAGNPDHESSGRRPSFPL